MPWTAADAKRHTHRANTPKKKKKWAEVANHVLQQQHDDAMAIRIANDAIKSRIQLWGLLKSLFFHHAQF
jgi:Holliday junction resolvase-like predicted endonuclease